MRTILEGSTGTAWALAALALAAWPAPARADGAAAADAAPAAQAPAPAPPVQAHAVAAAESPAPTAPAAPADKPQVRVEARVLEWQVTDSLDFDYAVQFDRKSGAGGVLDNAELILPADPAMSSAARLFLGNMDAGNGSFEAMIETLKQVGTVKVLSQPSLVLESLQLGGGELNDPKPRANGESKVSTGLRIPYETTRAIGVNLASVTEYRDSGVTMDVAVLRVEDQLIFLDLNTSVTDVTGFISVGLNRQDEAMRVPTLDTRSIHNRLAIPNRRTFLAGLMKTSRQLERRRGIPWISEIPVLSWILSNHKNGNEETELVFLVRPEIITPYQKFDVADGGSAQ